MGQTEGEVVLPRSIMIGSKACPQLTWEHSPCRAPPGQEDTGVRLTLREGRLVDRLCREFLRPPSLLTSTPTPWVGSPL